MKNLLRALLWAALLAAPISHAQAPKGLQVPGGAVEAAPAGTVPWELLQQAKTVQKADKKLWDPLESTCRHASLSIL